MERALTHVDFKYNLTLKTIEGKKRPMDKNKSLTNKDTEALWHEREKNMCQFDRRQQYIHSDELVFFGCPKNRRKSKQNKIKQNKKLICIFRVKFHWWCGLFCFDAINYSFLRLHCVSFSDRCRRLEALIWFQCTRLLSASYICFRFFHFSLHSASIMNMQVLSLSQR